MKYTTDWEEIGLSNDFIFGKVMSDPELCKELLERILPGIEIDHIEYPELQKPIKEDVDARSVRLDVYVKDGKNTVYDIEMQTVNTRELPKRSRYYQGMIDLQLIDTGQPYKKLNQSYIIFICLEDIFGKRANYQDNDLEAQIKAIFPQQDKFNPVEYTIVNELYNDNLFSVQVSLEHLSYKTSNYDIKITPLGQEFLQFIAEEER